MSQCSRPFIPACRNSYVVAVLQPVSIVVVSAPGVRCFAVVVLLCLLACWVDICCFIRATVLPRARSSSPETTTSPTFAVVPRRLQLRPTTQPWLRPRPAYAATLSCKHHGARRGDANNRQRRCCLNYMAAVAAVPRQPWKRWAPPCRSTSMPTDAPGGNTCEICLHARPWPTRRGMHTD